jgi:AcrR family transcriptional regulator
MTSPFRQKLHQTRRELILDAAIDVLAEKGFQRATVRAIASRAEIADGTIYNYFENKEAILFALVERLTAAEFRELHFAEAEQLDPLAFINTYVQARMTEIDQQFETLKVVMAETIIDADLGARVFEAVYLPGFESAEGYLAQLMGQDSDEEQLKIAARLFATPLLGLFFMRLIGDPHVSAHWPEYTQALATFMTRLVPAPSD